MEKQFHPVKGLNTANLLKSYRIPRAYSHMIIRGFEKRGEEPFSSPRGDTFWDILKNPAGELCFRIKKAAFSTDIYVEIFKAGKGLFIPFVLESTFTWEDPDPELFRRGVENYDDADKALVEQGFFWKLSVTQTGITSKGMHQSFRDIARKANTEERTVSREGEDIVLSTRRDHIQMGHLGETSGPMYFNDGELYDRLGAFATWEDWECFCATDENGFPCLSAQRLKGSKAWYVETSDLRWFRQNFLPVFGAPKP